jgi:hypothetical protein
MEREQFIDLDFGYSYVKIFYNNRFYKIPTSVAFCADAGIEFGENDTYKFEDELYHVGENASNESFTTTDFTFLVRFTPVLMAHIFNKLEIKPTDNIVVRTGLALNDWGDVTKREDFVKRLSEFNVNDIIYKPTVRLVGPQGHGSYISYLYDHDLTRDIPELFTVIDIGYNTINLLHYKNGQPQQRNSKGFVGHGVSSIIRPFTAWLENEFKINFTEQEALDIFMKKTFKISGAVQENIPAKIVELTNQFVQKLLGSVLVSEKKILQLSDNVLITGGGSYLFTDTQLPPNVVFSGSVEKSDYEYSNVKGYSYL